MSYALVCRVYRSRQDLYCFAQLFYEKGRLSMAKLKLDTKDVTLNFSFGFSCFCLFKDCF